MPNVPNLTLNNGINIPQLGFGTFQIKPEDTANACREALEIGYRHIDTAQMYRNESGVGNAVRGSGLPRDDIFITTKLDNEAHAPAEAMAAFETSLKALSMDHVDLFLIHWPCPEDGNFVDTWRTLEEIQASGRARSIGVSNFQPEHIQRLLDEDLTVPAVNQIEVHPSFVQAEVRAYCQEHGIVIEAWSPIARGKVLDTPVITEIADRIGHTPAQITLRWHLQRGDVIFPKSVHRERMAENFDLFDFELSDEDMNAITALDSDGRMGPHPNDIN